MLLFLMGKKSGNPKAATAWVPGSVIPPRQDFHKKNTGIKKMNKKRFQVPVVKICFGLPDTWHLKP